MKRGEYQTLDIFCVYSRVAHATKCNCVIISDLPPEFVAEANEALEDCKKKIDETISRCKQNLADKAARYNVRMATGNFLAMRSQ